MAARLFAVDLNWRLPYPRSRRTWRNLFVLLFLLVKKWTSAMYCLGLPRTLGEFSIKYEHLEKLAESAMKIGALKSTLSH
ncbi:hypothetical protein GGP41_008918 [Bipolaris sorokiniana]|uniref:Uncharacterized protein n=1 Tax=Cochliobolus sativus TaxID=45130 RepID=A0A8H5Z7C8_COCSA|nr:hypothetical protein GGP41_008918 [Bipolaris sorokiniana]